MQRALALAVKGWGQVAPNPLVGAVLLQLWKFRDPSVLPRLEPVLASDDVGLRRRLAYCLMRLQAPEAAPLLQRMVGDADRTVLMLVARGLGSSRVQGSIGELGRMYSTALEQQSRAQVQASPTETDVFQVELPAWQTDFVGACFT